MFENDNAIIGLGLDKSYSSEEEFTKDLLRRCPNAAVANPNLRDNIKEQNDISEG